MAKLLRALLLMALGWPALAAAQTSFVTTTGTNANYANGTITANFLPPANSSQFDYINGRFPFTQSATLNSSGTWSLSVADTSTLKPAGSQWQLNLCSQKTFTAPPTCFQVTMPVTCVNNVSCSGSTLDLTSSFAAAPTPTSSVDSVARAAAAAAQTTANAVQATAAPLTSTVANTILGSVGAVTPTGMAVPSCSTSASGLKWTSGTGIGCNAYTFGTLGAGTAANQATFPGGLLFLGGVNAQSGTSYTIAASDENKLLTFNNPAATSVPLPAATTAGFTSGAFFYTFNRGAGVVTITPTTSTINGNPTLVLAQNTGAFLESDGANYSAYVTGDAPKIFLSGATTTSTGVSIVTYGCTFVAGACTITHTVFTANPVCTITEINGGVPAGTTEPQIWISGASSTTLSLAASSTSYVGQAGVICIGK